LYTEAAAILESHFNHLFKVKSKEEEMQIDKDDELEIDNQDSNKEDCDDVVQKEDDK